MMRRLSLSLLVAICCGGPHWSCAQLRSYTFSEIDSLQQVDPRHVVVFIHTDWCRYCQTMKRTTLMDREVSDLLNNHFRFVEFNAEDKRAIDFNGQRFHYRPTGTDTGVHELAEALGTVNGRLSFPAVCILNSQYEIVFQYDQFLSASSLLEVLSVIREGWE